MIQEGRGSDVNSTEVTFTALRSFDAESQGRISKLLGHKGEPWLWDIACRLQSSKGNLFAVAKLGEDYVSNVYIGYDETQTSTVGIFGHVFTVDSHRRKGLSTKLLQLACATYDSIFAANGILILCTDSDTGVKLYRKVGFQDIIPENPENEHLMIRSQKYDLPFFRSLYSTSTERKLAIIPLTREIYSAAILMFYFARLLDTTNTKKLSALKIDNGSESEEGLIHALRSVHNGTGECLVCVDEEYFVHGVQYTAAGAVSLYAMPCRAEIVNTLFSTYENNS